MNKSTLSNFLIFVVGAGIGSAVTWKVLKTKYEQIIQEEIDSVKEVYSKLNTVDEMHEMDIPQLVKKAIEDGASNKTDRVTGVAALKEYDETLKKQGYVNYSDVKKQEEGGLESVEIDKPYQISPDEFGNDNEYDCKYLTYYEDGVLVYDETDDEVDDVGQIVGFDFFKYFGTYEDDIVWIRNDALECDYEITADHRNYTDVV